MEILLHLNEDHVGKKTQMLKILVRHCLKMVIQICSTVNRKSSSYSSLIKRLHIEVFSYLSYVSELTYYSQCLIVNNILGLGLCLLKP